MGHTVHFYQNQIIKYICEVSMKLCFSFFVLPWGLLASNFRSDPWNRSSWKGLHCPFFPSSLLRSLEPPEGPFLLWRGWETSLYFTIKISSFLTERIKKNVEVWYLFLNHSSDPYNVCLCKVRMSHLVKIV